jgi:hypothetical protein
MKGCPKPSPCIAGRTRTGSYRDSPSRGPASTSCWLLPIRRQPPCRQPVCPPWLAVQPTPTSRLWWRGGWVETIGVSCVASCVPSLRFDVPTFVVEFGSWIRAIAAPPFFRCNRSGENALTCVNAVVLRPDLPKPHLHPGCSTPFRRPCSARHQHHGEAGRRLDI